MKNRINISIQHIINENLRPYGMRFLQVCIYSWCLLGTILLLPAHTQFWSAQAYIPKPTFLDDSNILTKATNLLWYESFTNNYHILLIAQISLLILAIIGKGNRIVFGLIYFFTVNLDNKAWPAMDGGNNLIHLLLFYLIFLNPTKNTSKFSTWHYSMNNFSYLACRIQVVIVYLGAGLTKLSGGLWQKGVALYYVMNTDEYTHPFLKELSGSIPTLIVLGTYFTLLFQVSFPWLVWNKKLRPILLAAGTFIHFQIALFMGLFLFGIAMCASYTSFTSEKTAKKILNWFGLMNSKLTVAFDEDCKTCMKFAKFIKAIDWLNLIQIDNARQPSNEQLATINKSVLTGTIHSISSSNEIFKGFDTVSEIMARIPLFKPFILMIRVIQISTVGEIFYNRYILLSEWRTKCVKGICNL